MSKVINQTSTDLIINALAPAEGAQGVIDKDNVSATLSIDCGEAGTMNLSLEQLDAAYRGIVRCWPGISPIKQQIILNARQAVADAREAKKASKEADKLKAREAAEAARKAKEDAKEEARQAKEKLKAEKLEAAKLAQAEKVKADTAKAAAAASKLDEKSEPTPKPTVMEKNNAKAALAKVPATKPTKK